MFEYETFAFCFYCVFVITFKYYNNGFINFGLESTSTALVAALSGLALVVIGLSLAAAIGPRSYAPQKGETYECGIPTRGDSMVQFKVGYYLFAILFLMFDVETVLLFRGQ